MLDHVNFRFAARNKLPLAVKNIADDDPGRTIPLVDRLAGFDDKGFHRHTSALIAYPATSTALS